MQIPTELLAAIAAILPSLALGAAAKDLVLQQFQPADLKEARALMRRWQRQGHLQELYRFIDRWYQPRLIQMLRRGFPVERIFPAIAYLALRNSGRLSEVPSKALPEVIHLLDQRFSPTVNGAADPHLPEPELEGLRDELLRLAAGQAFERIFKP